MNLSEPLLFRDGAVKLCFDRDTHTYYRNAHDSILDDLVYVPGVTTICGIIDKSHYLMPWAVKMAANRLMATVPQRDGKTVPLTMEEFETLVLDAKKAHRVYTEDAANIGLDAHLWIEAQIKTAIRKTGGIVHEVEFEHGDKRVNSCCRAAFNWMQSHNVRWISTEKKIYSAIFDYAGTLDGIALVDSCGEPGCCKETFKDQYSLIDWKSSNQLSIVYLLQTAAYAVAEEEETKARIAARWILRLGKDNGAFEAWYESTPDGPCFETQDFVAFQHCLGLYRNYHAIEDRMHATKRLKKWEKQNAKQVHTGTRKSRRSAKAIRSKSVEKGQ